MNILKAFLTAFIAVAALISPTTSILAATLINIGGTNDTSVNTSANAEIDEDSSVDDDDDENLNTSGQIDAEGNVSDSSDRDDGNDGVFSVSRDSITTSLETGQINSHLSSSVRTDEDLKIFAETTLRNDENIEEIEFDEDNISVVYNDQGKFLGFIPVNIDVEASVNKKGEVDVEYPWYSFMITGSEKTNIQAALRDEVEDMDWVSTESDTEVTWTASDRAMIAARIQAILQSYIGKKAKTNVDANTRTEDNSEIDENADSSLNATSTSNTTSNVE